MILPVGPEEIQTLLAVKKDEHGNIEQQPLGEVRFVEFKGKYGWN